MASRRTQVDSLVIGGGFYGCSLALFLKTAGEKVTLVEAEDRLLARASRVNQARVHTGFHYPRSPLTAVKSMVLHRRFLADFPQAVVGDFDMLYAIARHRSKISARRFHRMFADMGAPIAPATPAQAALFSSDMVEQAFACREYAFDYRVLARQLGARLDAVGVDLRLGTRVTALAEHGSPIIATLSNGEEIEARQVFNVTYAQINALLDTAGLPQAALKHELAEVALVEVPPKLMRIGITVLDGPFFSCMPYPAEGLHSLTHVRLTPQASWTDASAGKSAYEVFAAVEPQARHRHMLLDAQRYVPALAGAQWRKSLHEVKTVLVKNEKDDGRPILFHRAAGSRVCSVMGGKIDNIYDLFDILRQIRPDWRGAESVFSGAVPA